MKLSDENDDDSQCYCKRLVHLSSKKIGASVAFDDLFFFFIDDSLAFSY